MSLVRMGKEGEEGQGQPTTARWCTMDEWVLDVVLKGLLDLRAPVQTEGQTSCAARKLRPIDASAPEQMRKSDKAEVQDVGMCLLCQC